MAIDSTPETKQVVRQRRTFEVVINSPAVGEYSLQFARHSVDKDTRAEFTDRARKFFALTQAQALALPTAGPILAQLLAALPADLDAHAQANGDELP